MQQAQTPVSSLPANPGADRILLWQSFVRIVEAGSLSAAAAQLGTTQPTVSRRLQSLEQAVGLRLLQRSTHGMRLTLDGERLYERAKDLLAQWEAFETDLAGAQALPEGFLRVAVPHAFGQEKLVLPLVRFLQRHPGMRVDWSLQYTLPDFISTGFDCAIHVGEVADPSVVALKLTEVPRIIVAAPELEGLADEIDQPEALASLPWLALSTYYRNEVVLFHTATRERRRLTLNPRMSTDSSYALRSAARLGLGVCVLSAWLLEQDLAQGQLRQLLPQWQAAPLPVYLVYPPARFQPPRLKRFIELMRAEAPGAIGELETKRPPASEA